MDKMYFELYNDYSLKMRFYEFQKLVDFVKGHQYKYHEYRVLIHVDNQCEFECYLDDLLEEVFVHSLL